MTVSVNVSAGHVQTPRKGMANQRPRKILTDRNCSASSSGSSGSKDDSLKSTDTSLASTGDYHDFKVSSVQQTHFARNVLFSCLPSVDWCKGYRAARQHAPAPFQPSALATSNKQTHTCTKLSDHSNPCSLACHCLALCISPYSYSLVLLSFTMST